MMDRRVLRRALSARALLVIAGVSACVTSPHIEKLNWEADKVDEPFLK
jgi:hypothetical protein